MLSLKTLLIPAILSLAATTTATATATARDCPKDWYKNTSYGGTRCCFGYMSIVNYDTYCCIPDLAEEYQKPRPTDWFEMSPCLEKVHFTATDYSSRVSSASKKATDALYSLTASNIEASATSEPSASVTSTDMTSGSGSGTSAGSETSTTSNAAVPAVTAGGMIIGGAAVAAVLAL